MELNKLKASYLLVLLLIFFYFKIFLAFFILYLIIDAYTVSQENDIEHNYQSFIPRQVHLFMLFDTDADNEYLGSFIDKDSYAIYNCRFFFDIYGGPKTLIDTDYYWNNYSFLDIRNFINIYNKMSKKRINDVENLYVLYYFKEKYRSNLNKFKYLKFFNKDFCKYIDNKEKLNDLNLLINIKSFKLNIFKKKK